MSNNSDKERGEKRGLLRTDRATKQKQAADRNDNDNESTE